MLPVVNKMDDKAVPDVERIDPLKVTDWRYPWPITESLSIEVKKVVRT